MRVLMAMSLP
jgi:hypothetical protein